MAGNLPAKVYSAVTDLRLNDPGLPLRLARARQRRRSLTTDGKLALLAADHVARMVTSIEGDALRMAGRRDLLARVLRIVACSPLDGVLASPDLMDELFIVQSLSKAKFLARKLLIGSTNRGGLSGAVFELDDRLTGYSAKGIARMKLDGAKFLLRVDPSRIESLQTLELCSSLARECGALGIPFFLELLPVAMKEGGVTVEKDAEKLAKLVGVASALGDSSTRIWLKLPYVEGFEAVASATTCPILILGGEAKEDPEGLFQETWDAMRAGPNVRGVLTGRNILCPKGSDPRGMAFAIDAIVHHGATPARAMKVMHKESWKECSLFND